MSWLAGHFYFGLLELGALDFTHALSRQFDSMSGMHLKDGTDAPDAHTRCIASQYVFKFSSHLYIILYRQPGR